MNSLLARFAAQVLQMLCAGEYRRFQKQLEQPEQTQAKLLKTIVQDSAKTSYGQSFKIKPNDDYKAFSKKLPIQTYDALEPWIQEQLKTKQPVITPHRIIHVEPTSGSSGAAKQIPYTAPLLHSFSNMFRIWAYDQLRYGFTPETGKLFASISPPTSNSGFSDDREYLSRSLRILLSPFLVLPPKHYDSETFQQRLAVTLLEESDLEIISVWSPSYLLVLMDYIQRNHQTLATLLPPARRHLLSDSVNWQNVWPKLKLISCWDSGLAEPLAQQLRERFPNVHAQGKGLLATEAPMTVPLIQASTSLPLIQSVFFEFETEDGDIKRLHELLPGEQAEIIISQRGGLLRYRIGDHVMVQRRYRNTPSLTFIGRTKQICDMAGEKLNEAFVTQALLQLIPSSRFLLVPYRNMTNCGYALLTNENETELAEKADAALCQAYHYRNARYLKQLSPPHTICIPNLQARLQAFYQSEGMKLGDIKDRAFIHDPEQGMRLLAFIGEQPDTWLPLPPAQAAENTRRLPVRSPEVPLPAGP